MGPQQRRSEPALPLIWSENLSAALVKRSNSDTTIKVTWLNHYSAMRALENGVRLNDFDYIGIDGNLLRLILGRDIPRTSADLLLPLLFNSLGRFRLGVIGSKRHNLDVACEKLKERWPQADIIWSYDGFNELPDPSNITGLLPPVDVLVVGLGSPLQDSFITQVPKGRGAPRIILSCGGWLDQIGTPEYYPRWAYPLHLNWMVRLAREPLRLWRRYSVDAAYAWNKRQDLRAALSFQPGISNAANDSQTA